MADTTIDFEHRTCPHCGAEGFEIKSEEKLYGTCGLVVLSSDALEWDGYTEIDWNSQRTDFFFCGECDTKLPDDWQEAISNALVARS